MSPTKSELAVMDHKIMIKGKAASLSVTVAFPKFTHFVKAPFYTFLPKKWALLFCFKMTNAWQHHLSHLYTLFCFWTTPGNAHGLLLSVLRNYFWRYSGNHMGCWQLGACKVRALSLVLFLWLLYTPFPNFILLK